MRPAYQIMTGFDEVRNKKKFLLTITFTFNGFYDACASLFFRRFSYEKIKRKFHLFYEKGDILELGIDEHYAVEMISRYLKLYRDTSPLEIVQSNSIYSHVCLLFPSNYTNVMMTMMMINDTKDNDGHTFNYHHRSIILKGV